MFSVASVKKAKFKFLWPWLIIILVSLIILLPQIMGGHMIVGEDCWFHMNRAYEDMEQFKTGHFSYFLNLFSFNSSGRIVNGLYGPIGGYLEGLLLLTVKSWYRWEIANSWLVLVVAGLSMYYVARKLNVSYWPSVLSGILYLGSFPFDRWVINQNFDGFGAMLLPWFLLAGCRIFRHDFSPLKLALLVTVTSQIHLMSAAIGTASLLVSFILANCYSGRIKLWLKVLKAVGLYFLLTINVWGALFEVRASNYLVPPVPYRNFLSARHTIYGWMITQPVIHHLIIEMVLFLILGLMWIVLHRADVMTKFLMVQGVLFLWLASEYFPWTSLLKHHSMIASYLQFPERFLPIGIAAILLLATRLKPKWVMIILLSALTLINLGFDVQAGQNKVNSQYHALMQISWNVVRVKPLSFQGLESTLHSNDPKTFINVTKNRVPDYLPSKVLIDRSYKYYRLHPDTQNTRQIINDHLRVNRSVVGRNVEKLTFNAQPGREITLPFVKYGHTELRLNHRLVDPRLTRIHTVKLRPRQRTNVLEARYRPSGWYEALVFIEVVAGFSIIINVITKYFLSRRV